MCRAVQPRLSAESGFWKTIWIERLSAVGRSADCGGERVVVELDGAAGVGALDAEDRLGQRRLARPGLADEAQRLAVVELRSTLTRAGTSWPLWWNVLDTCRVEREIALGTSGLADAAPRLREVADAVVVVAARPVADADLDDGRHDGPAQVVASGQRST